MKLIVTPNDGPAALLAAIRKARRIIEVAIFRFDRADIEKALKAAAANGVKVVALIAYSNRGGEQSLRQLETRFLEAGIIVARTDSDLMRYHDKLMIIDRRELYMLSFNFTHADIDHSRGFGIVTRNAKWVQEAVKLLDCDRTRTVYKPEMETFVVSPENSRASLSAFLKRAKKQLLIYDPKISDKRMLRILQDRARAGVEIRIIGKVDSHSDLKGARLKMRLHTRTIIRDRHQAFVGSQSLRLPELDSRREVGLIVHDPIVVKKLADTFEADWESSNPKQTQEKTEEQVVQNLVDELHPLAATLKRVVKRVVADAGEEAVEDKTVKDTVKRVIKRVVKQAVREAVQEQ